MGIDNIDALKDDSDEPTERELKERLITLTSQIQFCIDYMDTCNLLDEHCFTFPDGETVWATQTLESDGQ